MTEEPSAEAMEIVGKVRDCDIECNLEIQTIVTLWSMSEDEAAKIIDAAVRRAVEAERERWAHVVELYRYEAKHKGDGRNPYHGHGHSVEGIWDSDNGALAGKECAACAMARIALNDKEAAHDPE